MQRLIQLSVVLSACRTNAFNIVSENDVSTSNACIVRYPLWLNESGKLRLGKRTKSIKKTLSARNETNRNWNTSQSQSGQPVHWWASDYSTRPVVVFSYSQRRVLMILDVGEFYFRVDTYTAYIRGGLRATNSIVANRPVFRHRASLECIDCSRISTGTERGPVYAVHSSIDCVELLFSLSHRPINVRPYSFPTPLVLVQWARS